LVSLADLMAKVGYFLFYWSGLEQELSRGIRSARERIGKPTVAVCGSFSERLDLWCQLITQTPEHAGQIEAVQRVRDQALALQKIRNLIVHGLEVANSMPPEGPARIKCAMGGYDNPTGETVTYSIDQLEHFTQAADACRRAFVSLGAFNYHLDIRRRQESCTSSP
jgi:hypothetical protein